MYISGASIVKGYIEKYVYINRIKSKKNGYINQPLARKTLSGAYNIIHEMNYLILSNNSNDFERIKDYLKQQVALIHKEIKKNRSFLVNICTKTVLPSDFGACINAAWYKLHYFEKHHKTKKFPSPGPDRR